MAVFKSHTVSVPVSADVLFDKLTDMSSLRAMLQNVPADKIPSDQREMFDAVEVGDDYISFPTPAVGNVKLQMAEKVRPSKVRLEGVGTPVALSLILDIEPESADSCRGTVSIDITIPAILKPMVAGPLDKLITQFADMLPAVGGVKA